MKSLYRGFCRTENGNETIYFNGEAVKGEWVQGYFIEILDIKNKPTASYILENLAVIPTYPMSISPAQDYYEVIPETVSEAVRGLTDKNGRQVFEGDRVKFFGMIGKVCFEQGCFGIGTQETIDWKKIKKQILPLTGCDNKPYFCENDNFVSFWELIWNFNGEDEQCEVCEVIGTKWDKGGQK